MAGGVHLCRQLEFERFPISIEDEMERQVFFGQLRTECQAVRLLAPVRLVKLDAMPGLAGAAQELVQTPPLALSVHFAQGPARSQELDEPMETRVLPHQVPVKPTGLVVLAVGVVVPALAPSRF